MQPHLTKFTNQYVTVVLSFNHLMYSSYMWCTIIAVNRFSFIRGTLTLRGNISSTEVLGSMIHIQNLKQTNFEPHTIGQQTNDFVGCYWSTGSYKMLHARSQPHSRALHYITNSWMECLLSWVLSLWAQWIWFPVYKIKWSNNTTLQSCFVFVASYLLPGRHCHIHAVTHCIMQQMHRRRNRGGGALGTCAPPQDFINCYINCSLLYM